jgi:riboflavin kinase / FMN adenylyltransferase
VIQTQSLEGFELKKTWLTIGMFDGIHRGHMQLLQRLVNGAHEEGQSAVVITFSPHPAIVLGGKTDFKNLMTTEELMHGLELLGMDAVIIQPFSRQFADQTAEEYMRIVKKQLDLSHLIIGFNTALGRGREGNTTRLVEIGNNNGYEVEVIPAVSDENGIISSTRIRREISSGNVSLAARGLGRYFEITGSVIHGDGRGHILQIPTANIQVPENKIIPANGIYACWAHIEGEAKRYMAATNVGIRPTFKPSLADPAVEAHLLDFHEEIYGRQVRLEFVEYLRTEEKYSSVDTLVRQIKLDIEQTFEVLTAILQVKID